MSLRHLLHLPIWTMHSGCSYETVSPFNACKPLPPPADTTLFTITTRWPMQRHALISQGRFYNPLNTVMPTGNSIDRYFHDKPAALLVVIVQFQGASQKDNVSFCERKPYTQAF